MIEKKKIFRKLFSLHREEHCSYLLLMVEHVVIMSHDPHMGKGRHIQPGWLSKARGATYKMWQSFKETTVSSLASPLPISIPKSVIQYDVIFLKKALEITCFMRSPTRVPHQAKDSEALRGQRHRDPFHHGARGARGGSNSWDLKTEHICTCGSW